MASVESGIAFGLRSSDRGRLKTGRFVRRTRIPSEVTVVL
jgi:hypothetical protein